jgi:hypothetical protein
MGTLTLTNTNTVYPDIDSLFSAINGVDFGSPARVSVSGIVDERPGTIAEVFPQGVVFFPAPGEAFNGLNGDTAATIRTTQENNYGFITSRTGSLVRFENLALALVGQYTGRFFTVDQYYDMHMQLHECFIDGGLSVNSTSNGRLLTLTPAAGRSHVFSAVGCVIRTRGGLVAATGSGDTSGASVSFDQCTLVDVNNRNSSEAALVADYDFVSLTDTYIADGVPSDVSGSVSSLTNVATSDTTSYGTGAVLNVTSTVALEDKATGDYRLKAGSALIGAGTAGGNIGSSVGQSVVDTTKPVIQLNALPVVNLIVGDTYVQAAATATDETDGVVTVDVGGDTVVTTGVNSFTVTFDATDAAGNVAIQVTQTINVVAPATVAPAGVPVIGAYSVTDNSITFAATYADSDSTGMEFSTDGGTTVVAFTSPAVIPNRTQDTTYPLIVRAVNGVGPGDWSAPTNIKTDVTVLVGVRGDAVPPPGLTGSKTGSVIYKHLNLPADADDIWRVEAVAPGLAGLTLNQDGSYFVTGMTLVSVYEFGYNVYKNNVLHAANQVWHINMEAPAV